MSDNRRAAPAVTETRCLALPAKDLVDAKRQYVEQYGSVLVMNTYLKIALLALSVVAVGLILLTARTAQWARTVRPLIVRIDDVGRAEAVSDRVFDYQPQAPELKYFLVQFVTRYYARRRATLRDNLAASLAFLDGRLADAVIAANRQTKALETFLTTPGEEIEVVVRNVALEDLRAAPYKAVVEYEKVYTTPQDHLERRREAYVGHVVFVLKDHIPNALIPINPLGLTITYVREDQAFVPAPGAAR